MKKLKHILFAFIFSLIIGSQGIVSHAASLSNLQGGIYTITNDVSHENETGMAMARSYLKEKMTLEKSNGSWYYTIKFSGLQYMSKHKIYVNGSKVSHTVVSKNTSADTIELKFKTKSITPKLKVTMYVSAMGRNVEFGIIPKESTLKLVKATEESKSENSTNSTNNTNSSSNKTNNSTSNKNNSTSSNKTSSNKTNSSSSSSTKSESKSESKSDKTEKESNKAEEETDEAVKETEDKDKAEEDKEIEAKDEAEEDKEDEEVVEKTTEEVVSEVSDEKSSNKLVFVGLGAIVVIAIIVLVLRKIKK